MREFFKKRVLRLPHSILLGGYWPLMALPALWGRVSAAKAASVPAFSFEGFERGSDTLFILGSGYSINELSDEMLKQIATHDSFGFNFWPIHPLVPSLYFCEVINPELNEISRDAYHRFQGLAESRPDYSQVPKLISDVNQQTQFHWKIFPESWHSELYSLQTFPIFARNEEEVATALRILLRAGFFRQTRVVLKYRATVVMLVALGYALGYRRIVLCGFDITDTRYFYHHEKYREWNDFVSSTPGAVHATATVKPMMATVPETLSALEKVVLKPSGCEILLASSSSALHPRFPVFRW